MKTAMEELIEYIEEWTAKNKTTDGIWSKAKSLLSKEKQQIIDACEKMYSEEEVFNFLMDFWMEKRREFKTNPVCVANWFEQFKKKIR
jgi:hypothetical protein